MHIAVTGSNGRVGRYVVRELLQAGHTVACLDVARAASQLPATQPVDVTDADQLQGALAGADGVVHLAAWQNIGMVSDSRTYGDNVRGAFNVFQSCAELGIKRIISASSNHIYGMAAAPPIYVPVDEVHPLRIGNCYALSKMAGEQAATWFVETQGLEILSFRIMGARRPDELPSEIEAMAKNPESDRRLLWTRTDARDVAAACRLALEAQTVAPGPYNITGARVVLNVPTEDLIKRYCGDQTEIRASLDGFASPMSCAKAKAAFGYCPRYDWTVSGLQDLT